MVKRLPQWLKKEIIFDTLTVRFMVLFLIALGVPLLSLSWFSSDLFESYVSQSIEDRLSISHELFLSQQRQDEETLLAEAAALKEEWKTGLGLYRACRKNGKYQCFLLNFPQNVGLLSDGQSLSLASFQQKAASLYKTAIYLPADTPTFLSSWEGTLFLTTRLPIGNPIHPDQVMLMALPLDDMWLDQFYQHHPSLDTEVWLLHANASPADSTVNPPEEDLTFATSRNSDEPAEARRIWKTLATAALPTQPGLSQLHHRVQQFTLHDGLRHPVVKVVHILPLNTFHFLFSYYRAGFYIILLAGLLLSSAIAFWASRMIIRPLYQLIEQVNAITDNPDLTNSQVTVKGFQEVNQLEASFNNLLERLRLEHQMKDDFVATLTHDLKVPLLAEKQTLAYFQSNTYGNLTETQREVIDVLQSANRSSLRLVNDLLEVSRYESGRVSLLCQTHDLAALVAETTAECQSLANEKSITIRVINHLSDPHVYIDAHEIKRVILNLLSNAITNTPRGGEIRCVLEDSVSLNAATIQSVGQYHHNTNSHTLKLEGQVLVSVQDSGVGFSVQDLPNLFKRFGANRDRNPMGIGLGLYNCYQVIQEHRGHIWLETTEGEGSAVNFLLPKTQSVAKDRRKRIDRRQQHEAPDVTDDTNESPHRR